MRDDEWAALKGYAAENAMSISEVIRHWWNLASQSQSTTFGHSRPAPKPSSKR